MKVEDSLAVPEIESCRSSIISKANRLSWRGSHSFLAQGTRIGQVAGQPLRSRQLFYFDSVSVCSMLSFEVEGTVHSNTNILCPSAMLFRHIQRRLFQVFFSLLVFEPVCAFSSLVKQNPVPCGRKILGAAGLSRDLLSVPGLDILSMKGPLDNVTNWLLHADVIHPISGGYQFRLLNTETFIAYQKGMAMGSTLSVDSPIPYLKFPVRAEDFVPGTFLNLRPWWSWTIDRDFQNSHKLPVSFSAFPSKPHIH
ncbi:hypothetical protein GYMLUDRAFT_63641 [Collybiopsis luxurians FD-317 M1]|uniref:Uncharacterized protein n=1 Tax=Collybiopsis luxurians FD-317 M1 TaxID=944289 RepID=A0A0D0CF70_9AGAR|nr:hypothetical protein GYMLUDRAFT_63641 [Collybiopsis luxurians FD-317 M1]